MGTNKNDLLDDDIANLIKEHTTQKQWAKITQKMSVEGAGISIVKQVIYQLSPMTENTSKVIEAIKDFALTMKQANLDFENKYK